MDDKKKNKKKTNLCNFGEKGSRTLKLQAANWQKNNIPEGNNCYYCTEVYEKIKDFDNALGQVHRACKKIFDLRCMANVAKRNIRTSK